MFSFARTAFPYLAAVSPRLGRFLGDRKGTPSIETVAIIAFIALALFPYLRDIGGAIGNVFTSLSNNLNSQVRP
ncbi:MAG: Flp family type IVb pilin [Thermodesulfobacteriota bacterium]